jgi:hypothetical protein
VIRLPRPALALVALASIVIAGGCSSGTQSITDPNEVITRSVAAAPAVKSVHVKVEVSGKVNVGALGGGNPALSLLSGNLGLAGTSAEGDVDVSNQATDLKIALPSPFGTGEVIVVGGNLYYKFTLAADKFTMSKLSDTVPVSIPSPGAVASTNPSALAASLSKSLADAGAKTTLLADDKVGGTDAYHVSISVPVDKINGLLATAGTSTTAGMQLDSASVDYWAYKDGLLPAQLEVKASAGTLGNLDITVTLTDYNRVVTINAPAAGDIAG